MAQKSLPLLNKINVSLVWYITYFNKYFKWLSLQTFYFMIFFNKYCESLNFTLNRSMWQPFESNTLYSIGRLSQQRLVRSINTKSFNSTYILYLGPRLLVVNLYYYKKKTINNSLLSSRNDKSTVDIFF